MTPAEIDQAMALLRDRVTASSITAAARALDYSRPAVSMALAGRYEGRLDRLAQRVMERFGGVECPHLGVTITAQDCASNRNRPLPTGSTQSFRLWQACQRCPHNTDSGETPSC